MIYHHNPNNHHNHHNDHLHHNPNNHRDHGNHLQVKPASRAGEQGLHEQKELTGAQTLH